MMVTERLQSVRTRSLLPILGLFFVSGAAALVYEVLWLKELGRLFGVTAYTTATTLGVFFLGLALGGLALGRRAERIRNPLRAYAWLEIGIAASAIVYLLLLNVYRELQTPIFSAIGYQPTLLLLVKFVLACGILLVPSFFMGGTLPVMAQFLVRRRAEFGSRTTLLYATNTIGAATGALTAGFFLPPALGFRGSYGIAIALNIIVALIAWYWSAKRPAVAERPSDTALVDEPPSVSASATTSPWIIVAVAAFSGMATLGLEVVWTRMFAQVLQNSVYTFAVILGVFLICLSVGSGVAHLLCKRPFNPRLTLSVLLALSGVIVGLTPLLFSQISGTVNYLRSDLGFVAYVGVVFAGIGAVLGLAVVAMGTVFPYLMKLSERQVESAGRTVGQLVAINTFAAIVGSLLAGFWLLDLLGVWGSIRAFALLYLALALVLWPWQRPHLRRWSIPVVIGLAVVGLVLPYSNYSRIWLDEDDNETLVEAWEGAAGSVAVVRTDDDNLRIRVNSSYNLGSTAAAVNERLQGQIPLLMHDNPRRVFFLGLGTGITASGALNFPVDRVVVCEINPDVIRASRAYFTPWLRGLFDDPRVTVLPEDGRTWLAATNERFDVIVADIFLGFKSDVGSLYTLEHFQSVRNHLSQDGMFVQWLPFFDMSAAEFEIVAKTMLEVFPSVTLWRRSHSPRFPVYALVARQDDAPLDTTTLQQGLEYLHNDPALDPRTWILNIPLAAYATNMSALDDRLAARPTNTDDRTVLEYTAPVTERNSRGSGKTAVLAWRPLLQYLEGLLEDLPPENDPYLRDIDPSLVRQVYAGVAQYGYTVHRILGNEQAADRYQAAFQQWLGEIGSE
ncbi:MAG: hypothetical protein GF341_13175 [candidate division Zixibacteria bacterium]|nr:hypothetical protein [candidate division Zixibacteria bacterium]